MSFKASAAGVTLLELAITMMITAVIGVGVSGLIKAGAEHSLSERQHQTMRMMAMSLIEDLRFDLRTADSINSLGGGSNTLVIHQGAQTITYNLDTGTHRMTRTFNGKTKIYNDPSVFLNNMQFSCQTGAGATTTCFQNDPEAGAIMGGPPTVVAANGTPKAVLVPNLTVTAALPSGSGGTVIDQAFGPPSFQLTSFSFNVASATEFQ